MMFIYLLAFLTQQFPQNQFRIMRVIVTFLTKSYLLHALCICMTAD